MDASNRVFRRKLVCACKLPLRWKERELSTGKLKQKLFQH